MLVSARSRYQTDGDRERSRQAGRQVNDSQPASQLPQNKCVKRRDLGGRGFMEAGFVRDYAEMNGWMDVGREMRVDDIDYRYLSSESAYLLTCVYQKS